MVHHHLIADHQKTVEHRVSRDSDVMQLRDPQLWVTLIGLILFAAVVVLLILIG
jgi:hypothetical protein